MDQPIVSRRASKIYLVNLALLATHEIDSAYWHEWELFRLPGGIQFFLVVNLGLLAAVLYGFERVVRLDRSSRFFSCLLAGMGIFAFVVHTAFLFAAFRSSGIRRRSACSSRFSLSRSYRSSLYSEANRVDG